MKKIEEREVVSLEDRLDMSKEKNAGMAVRKDQITAGHPANYWNQMVATIATSNTCSVPNSFISVSMYIFIPNFM